MICDCVCRKSKASTYKLLELIRYTINIKMYLDIPIVSGRRGNCNQIS